MFRRLHCCTSATSRSYHPHQPDTRHPSSRSSDRMYRSRVHPHAGANLAADNSKGSSGDRSSVSSAERAGLPGGVRKAGKNGELRGVNDGDVGEMC